MKMIDFCGGSSLFTMARSQPRVDEKLSWSFNAAATSSWREIA